MLVTDDRLVRGSRPRRAGPRGRARRGHRGPAPAQAGDPPRAGRRWPRALVAGARIPVLVNDRPDVALAAGAAGRAPRARGSPGHPRPAPSRRRASSSARRSGPRPKPLAAAEADYWGIGPWRDTTTKADAGTALGTEGFREAGRAWREAQPCLAIGGVRPVDVPSGA